MWARDHDAGKKYAEQHGFEIAHATYSDMCNDPEVDIIYIASKTFDHHWQAMEAIAAGKNLLVEKPFTDTAAQAKEIYAAADAAGVAVFEGMWTKMFPAYEHARAALDAGMIGDVLSVQSDYTDMVYALTACPFAFGHGDEMPIVKAVGRAATVQQNPGGPGDGEFSGGGGSGGILKARGVNPAAVALQYTKHQGVASIIISAGRFPERTEIVGTTGRITIEVPSHHPDSVTIRAGYPKRRGDRKPALEMGEDGWEGDCECSNRRLGLLLPRL